MISMMYIQLIGSFRNSFVYGIRGVSNISDDDIPSRNTSSYHNYKLTSGAFSVEFRNDI